MSIVSHKSYRETQNKHFILTNFVFRKLCLLWENLEKYCRAYFFFFENRAVCGKIWKKYCRGRQATDDNMAHAHCMLDTSGYKRTLRICNTFLLFHSNSGCTNAPAWYVIRKVPIFFYFAVNSFFFVKYEVYLI